MKPLSLKVRALHPKDVGGDPFLLRPVLPEKRNRGQIRPVPGHEPA